MGKLHNRVSTFLLMSVLLSFGGAAIAQDLTPDLPEITDPLGNRTPLILIHGLCGSPKTTWKHRQGFTKFFNGSDSLKANFKLYYFSYSSGSNVRAVRSLLNCSARENPDHTPARIQGLAVALHQALRDTQEIGSNKPIAIVAHSLGGLIARSLLQELQDHQRTLLLITLATPHHGTHLARTADVLAGNLTSLYWDEYDFDNPQVVDNDWLRCLNGLSVNNPLICLGSDLETRTGTFQKIVAFGLARQLSLLDLYPDDHLVPIQSS